jgi:hypothetical protein
MRSTELHGVAHARSDVCKVLLSLFLLQNTVKKSLKIKNKPCFIFLRFFHLQNFTKQERRGECGPRGKCKGKAIALQAWTGP